ncbi:MAG: hypothetical protein QOE47_659 [Pyrinomonadaceae bacterium]|jgi:hypothetical protein|nr:hypothetical protein [Pyrinomonadaceae bacterium]
MTCTPEPLSRPARRAQPFVRRFALVAVTLALASSVALFAPHAFAQRKKAQPAPQYFVGEVEYKVTARGSNEQGVAAFRAFAPSAVKIIYGRQGFRIIETGGFKNNVLLNYARGEAFLLDDETKTAAKVSVMNLDDEQGAELAKIMPYHFKTEMQPTGKAAVVGGQPCRVYQVTKSAFIRDGATASICVAEALKFKPSRYSFENDTQRADSPLPLSLPVSQGAILKVEINESGVEAVYEAVKITPGAPAASLFNVPAGYRIKSDK